MNEPKIIRPFGVLGGRYAVGDEGFRLYRFTWAIAVAGIVIITAASIFHLPLREQWAITVLGFVAVTMPTLIVAKRGTRL